jgi:very-short-patch-repair endonuclease
VVEIDGTGHDRDPTRLDDAQRDALLKDAGWTVLRLRRGEVFERREQVRNLTRLAFSFTKTAA